MVMITRLLLGWTLMSSPEAISVQIHHIGLLALAHLGYGP